MERNEGGIIMKKLTTGFIAVVCILVLGSMTVFAAGQVQQRSSQQGGAADNSAERVYNHYNKYCSTESGCGYCGENGHCYVDEDGDGVCAAGGSCAAGYGYGCGDGHGHGHGHAYRR